MKKLILIIVALAGLLVLTAECVSKTIDTQVSVPKNTAQEKSSAGKYNTEQKANSLGSAFMPLAKSPDIKGIYIDNSPVEPRAFVRHGLAPKLYEQGIIAIDMEVQNLSSKYLVGFFSLNNLVDAEQKDILRQDYFSVFKPPEKICLKPNETAKIRFVRILSVSIPNFKGYTISSEIKELEAEQADLACSIIIYPVSGQEGTVYLITSSQAIKEGEIVEEVRGKYTKMEWNPSWLASFDLETLKKVFGKKTKGEGVIRVVKAPLEGFYKGTPPDGFVVYKDFGAIKEITSFGNTEELSELGFSQGSISFSRQGTGVRISAYTYGVSRPAHISFNWIDASGKILTSSKYVGGEFMTNPPVGAKSFEFWIEFEN